MTNGTIQFIKNTIPKLLPFLILLSSLSAAKIPLETKTYPFIDQPIDVIIPCIDKDLETLDHCIEGIRNNGSHIRNIYIISPRPLTKKALWFDESRYPFSKDDIRKALTRHPTRPVHPRFLGWYYQQLLKFYAMYTIPNISENILLLDADTIFLNQVSFLNEKNGALLTLASEYWPAYFLHGARLVPGLRRLYPDKSGVAHHMLIQKPLLNDLFNIVEKKHNQPFWKAFCHAVPMFKYNSPHASEYEIYFNFALMNTDQVEMRPLKWDNITKVNEIDRYRNEGYHYVSIHSNYRE